MGSFMPQGHVGSFSEKYGMKEATRQYVGTPKSAPPPAPEPQNVPGLWESFWGGMNYPTMSYEQWLEHRDKHQAPRQPNRLNWLQRRILPKRVQRRVMDKMRRGPSWSELNPIQRLVLPPEIRKAIERAQARRRRSRRSTWLA